MKEQFAFFLLALKATHAGKVTTLLSSTVLGPGQRPGVVRGESDPTRRLSPLAAPSELSWEAADRQDTGPGGGAADGPRQSGGGGGGNSKKK